MGVLLGLGAALGQAAGSLIARPLMQSGMDPYLASLCRVGASGLTMALIAMTPLGPPPPKTYSAKAMVLTAATAVIGLLIGLTLFL